MAHNEVRRFIDQRFHRNGIGGDGAVVTAFVSSDGQHLIATTLTPYLNDDLTPPTYRADWYTLAEPWVDRWVDAFQTRTVVIDPADPMRPLRGSDFWGHEIANEYRRRVIAGEMWPGQGEGHDPAMEWYDEQHADPAEVARLIAANNEAVEALFQTK